MENTILSDQEILTKMLQDSKACLHFQTLALAETTNPQLREIRTRHINQAIDSHFQLADTVVNQRYDSNPDPVNMLRKDTSVRLKL